MAGRSYTHVFIDESGDSGFKISRGSSPLFCIAAVVFHDPTNIEITDSVMQKLKTSLNLKKTHEFHFHNEPDRIRKAFCEAVCGCPFIIRAIVIDKNVIFEDTMLRKSPNHFYNFTTKMLLKHSFGSIIDAKVRIDGSMNRELKAYLRQELNRGTENRIIRDTKFLDSRISPMIQLADMAAGAIARSYKYDKRNSGECRRILQPRIEDIWDFGKIHRK